MTKTITHSILKIILIAIGFLVLTSVFTRYKSNEIAKYKIQKLSQSKAAEAIYPDGYPSVERYYDLHPLEYSEIANTYKSYGTNFEVKGNDIIVTYNLTHKKGMSKEWLNSKEFKTKMEKQAEESKPEKEKFCKKLSENCKIEKVRFIYKYLYKNKLVFENITES